jgi:UDP-N-acetylglucosamine transferase subunit ALG13
MPMLDNTEVQSLFVAGAGGHLEELWLLRPRLEGISDEVTWVTSDTPQSRSMLRDEARFFIPKSKPHDARATWTTTHRALEIVRRGDWAEVVSTGSLPAVPFLAIARAQGIPCHFIESAARVAGPSLSARILERVPGVHRYSQYESWARRSRGHSSWLYRGSVFDGFAPAHRPTGRVQNIVVTVGFSPYGFRRLVDAMQLAASPGAQVVWQTGSTRVSDLAISPAIHLPGDELFEIMRRADVVVAHAGVGSAITAMRAGHCPVLVPRRLAYGEHVDDHQGQIAAELARNGLALACEAGDLTAGVLTEAACRAVIPNMDAAPFVLGANCGAVR